MKVYIPYAAAAAALFSVGLGSPLRTRTDGKMAYDFSEVSLRSLAIQHATDIYLQLTASPKLTWTPCYDNL
jgi:hypothetical protein